MKRSINTSLGMVVVRVHPGSSHWATGPGLPPWVFLHGGSGSWRTFRALTGSGELSEEGDRVFLDLPGWGDSAGQMPFTVEQQSRAVVETLTALNYRSWFLFGHSMGAVLALDIAASHPGVTRAVVALSPTALTAAAALNQPVRHPVMAPLVGMYALMSLLRSFGQKAPTVLRLAEHTGLLRLILRPFFARPSLLQRQVFLDLALDARPASFIAAAHALRKYDAGMWQSITAPIILARGSKDIFTPPAEIRALALLIPHARTMVLAGSGHFAHIEDPAGIAALLTKLHAAAQTLDGPD